jgi:hypothetical protein
VARKVFLAIWGVYNGGRWVCRGSWIASAIGFDVGTSTVGSTMHHLAIVAGQSNTIGRRFCFTYHSDIRVSIYDGRKIRRWGSRTMIWTMSKYRWKAVRIWHGRDVSLVPARIARSIVWTHAQNTLCSHGLIQKDLDRQLLAARAIILTPHLAERPF